MTDLVPGMRNGQMIAPVERPASEKVCTQCGTRKPLDEFSRMRSGEDARHSKCKRCRTRREVDRLRGKRRKRLRRSIRIRQTADGLLDAARRLARECGGWEGVAEYLPMIECVSLVVRMDALAEEERLRADAERRTAVAELDSPGMQRALAETALAWLRDHPDALQAHLARLIAHHPSSLTRALTDAVQDPRTKAWLTRSGWTIEPPAE